MNAPRFILPGWALGNGPWQTMAARLSATVLPLPGYGDSPAETDFSRAVDTLADQLPPGSAVIGWSLGALLALALAARHPTRVSRLVLVAATASFTQREGWPHGMAPATLAAFREAFLSDPARQLSRFVGNFNLGDSQARAVTRSLLADADPLPPLPVLASGLDWLGDCDLRADLPALRCPTLLCQGEADPLMPLAGAQALAAALPGPVSLHVFSGCAHAPFVGAADGFAAALADFLEGCGP